MLYIQFTDYEQGLLRILQEHPREYMILRGKNEHETVFGVSRELYERLGTDGFNSHLIHESALESILTRGDFEYFCAAKDRMRVG